MLTPPGEAGPHQVERRAHSALSENQTINPVLEAFFVVNVNDSRLPIMDAADLRKLSAP
jgi:hypothetical protein